MTRQRLFPTIALVALLPAPAFAAPRDEVLRVSPPDAAFTLVVQNARDHVAKFRTSPFAAWFPGTTFGHRLLDSPDVRKLRDSVEAVCRQLGTAPDALLDDVLGDAVAFSYRPGPGGDPKDERGLILVRPRTPDALRKLVAALDDQQIKSGEVKAVVPRTHEGQPYAERQKPGGKADFYCWRGPVFAYSGNEEEIRGLIGRDRKVAPDAAAAGPVATMKRLGVENAAAVLLINPRALDAEVAAKAAAGKPDERAFLQRFGDYWKGLDAAALFVDLGRDAEFGLALVAKDGADGVPAKAGGSPSGLWAAVPDDALFAVAGRQKVGELADWLGGLLPDAGRKAVRSAVEQTLGPVVGRDRLPLVLDALGPDWGLWVEPPGKEAGHFLPVSVFALEVRTDGPRGAEAVRALGQAVDFGFQSARVAHNFAHPDRQIDAVEERDGDAVVKSLSSEAAFPPGVRPAFALKDGYLVIATDPAAVKRFRKPAAVKPGGEVPLVRVSAAEARRYLQTHADGVAKFVAERDGLKPADVAKELREFADALEPFDRVDVLTRGAGPVTQLVVLLRVAKGMEK